MGHHQVEKWRRKLCGFRTVTMGQAWEGMWEACGRQGLMTKQPGGLLLVGLIVGQIHSPANLFHVCLS
jgi:hypothetical protein